VGVIIQELPPFVVSLLPDDNGRVVVAVQGEVDAATADRLWAGLLEALTTWPGTVTVDLAQVTFLDSQGIKVLIRPSTMCEFDATRLIIRSPQPQVRRVFEVMGLATVLRIED
jgi:anti-anti-sigma factor